MPTIHLICGPVGAGKTTYSRGLASAPGVVRFSLDEWIMGLFGAEAPEPMHIDWWVERALRCSTRIWETSPHFLALGSDLVLDFGFATRAHRLEYRELALRAGAAVKLHIVVAEPGVRLERVRGRNRERGVTFALPVTDDMFHGSEAWWEPPDAEELGGIEAIRVTNGAVSG